MNNQAQEKHIVSMGDYGMVASGQKLYTVVKKRNRKVSLTFNLAPGQLVAFTPDTVNGGFVTIDDTEIAALTGDLYIGVGVSEDGSGSATNVRLLAGEKFDKCRIDETSVQGPRCGQPQVLATYIDCVQCRENYSAIFKYDDNRTRSFGTLRDSSEQIIVSSSPNCASCDDCAPEANCQDIVCDIVDRLNGDVSYDIGGLPYPDYKGFDGERPFRAVRLHENYSVFCLNPIADDCDCEDCSQIDALVSATINGTEVVFSGNLNPADDTKSFIGQLDSIACQIEQGFVDEIGPHSGFAFVTGGANKCCAAQLHVVTCDADFVLTDANGPVDPCEEIDPFPEFTDDANCVDCGASTATPYKPTCGLAVIIDQPEVDCGCYIDKPLDSYYRTGELTFVKNINEFSPIVKSAELMEMKVPRGFGAWIQWLEYQQDTGGRGRNYRDTNNSQGWLRLPDKNSRANNAITHSKCNKSYCTYYIGHSLDRPSITKSPSSNAMSSFIHIPDDDAVTVAAWEAFYTALLAANESSCKVIGSITCDEAKAID